jgi:hypothetical protein
MEIPVTISEILHILKAAGIVARSTDIDIEDMGVPHEAPKSLPKGKTAVYMFFYGNDAVKVGKVGSRSKARYTSQHYILKSAKSSLANSIVKEGVSFELTSDEKADPSGWIKSNTRRINILIDVQLGPNALNLIEAFMIAKLNPTFEGYNSQRLPKPLR